MLLREISSGTQCFVDADIFFCHLVDTPSLSQECSGFFSFNGWPYKLQDNLEFNTAITTYTQIRQTHYS
jgi:hypothetical protein